MHSPSSEVIKMLMDDDLKHPDPYVSYLLSLPPEENIIRNCFIQSDDKHTQEKAFILALNLIRLAKDPFDAEKDFLSLCSDYKFDLTSFYNYTLFQTSISHYIESLNDKQQFLVKPMALHGHSSFFIKSLIAIKYSQYTQTFFSDICNELISENPEPEKVSIPSITTLCAFAIFAENTNYADLLTEYYQNNESLSPLYDFTRENLKKLVALLRSILRKEGVCRQIGLRLLGALFGFFNGEKSFILNRDLIVDLLEIKNNDTDITTQRRLISLIAKLPPIDSPIFNLEQQITFYIHILVGFIQSPDDTACQDFKRFFELRDSVDTRPIRFSLSPLINNNYKAVESICLACNLFEKNKEFIKMCFNIQIIRNMRIAQTESEEKFTKRKVSVAKQMIDSMLNYLPNLEIVTDEGQQKKAVSIMLKLLLQLVIQRDILKYVENDVSDAISKFAIYHEVITKKYIKYGYQILSEVVHSKCIDIINQHEGTARKIAQDLNPYKSYTCTKVELIKLFAMTKSLNYQTCLAILSGKHILDNICSINFIVSYCLEITATGNQIKPEVDIAKEYIREKISDKNSDTFLEILTPTIEQFSDLIKISLDRVLMCDNTDLFVLFFECLSIKDTSACVSKLNEFAQKSKKIIRFNFPSNGPLCIIKAIQMVLCNTYIDLSDSQRAKISDTLQIILNASKDKTIYTLFYDPLYKIFHKQVSLSENTAHRLICIPQLAPLIPGFLKALSKNQFETFADSMKSICAYLKESYKPYKSHKLQAIIENKDINETNYALVTDQREMFNQWAESFFQYLTNPNMYQPFYELVINNVMTIIESTTLPCLVFMISILEQQKKRGFEIQHENSELLLSAVTEFLKGGTSAEIAIEFMSQYLNTKIDIAQGQFHRLKALIQILSDSIPRSMYKELIKLVSTDKPQLAHTIILQAILSNESCADIVCQNIGTLLDTDMNRYKYQYLEAVELYISKVSDFINKHYKDAIPVLIKHKQNNFITYIIKNLTLRKDGNFTICGMPCSNLYYTFFEYILSITDYSDFSLIEKAFIEHILQVKLYLPTLFSGPNMFLISAIIGVLIDDFKSFYNLESFLGDAHYFCNTDIPDNQISYVIERCDNSDQILIACSQYIADCLIQSSEPATLSYFFDTGLDVLSKFTMSETVLKSISTVSLFTLSRVLSTVNHKIPSETVEKISNFTSTIIRQCDNELMCLCASKLGNVDILGLLSDSMKQTYVSILSHYLTNALRQTQNIDVERAKLYCRLIQDVKEVSSESLTACFSVCPIDVLTSLIQLQYHDQIQIVDVFLFFLRNAKNGESELTKKAMEYLTYEAESEEKSVIANKVIETVDDVESFLNQLSEMRENSDVPVLLEWICLLSETNKAKSVPGIPSILVRVAQKFAKDNEKVNVSPLISRLLMNSLK